MSKAVDFDSPEFYDSEESDNIGFLQKSCKRRERMERSAKIRKKREQVKDKFERVYDQGFRGAYDN